MLVNRKRKRREKIKIDQNGQDKEKGIEEDEEGIDVEEWKLVIEGVNFLFQWKVFQSY